ncbi:MAG: transketolase C-terminal domain-containing protein [candidate division WOR-3 bacterium]
MKKIVAKTGNEALAFAMKQIAPDVVAAYPITPSTEVVYTFSSFVADGEVDTEFVAVESEHSAISACIAAAACGARAMTATASQGLALMHEMLFIASALRLPIVMAVVNRTLSAPLNIHCDHSDSLASRDSGWIQLFCANSQEAYDTLIQAVRIAEECYLPVMVTIDGFILSHCMERIEVLSDEEVKDFIKEFKPNYSLLDVDNPITVGPACLPDSYFEHKRAVAEAMRESLPVIEKVSREFGERFGRYYDIMEGYETKDCEVAIIAMGSTYETATVAVDNLREKGEKVGVFKLKTFRPFPHQKILKELREIPVLGVLDRAEPLSSYGGILYTEIRAVLADEKKKPLTASYIYGLGGREITPEEIEEVFEELFLIKEKGKSKEEVGYIGVK